MTDKRPLILLTNDDGIRSPGLLAVAEAACDLGELLLVAPATQQTGMGRASPPIIGGAVNEERVTAGCQEFAAYSLSAAPAQAVTYAVLVLCPRRPDLVISGINYGENLGTSVTASGTVGAALQAAEFGIPALAVSLETRREYHYQHGRDVDWRVAAQVCRRLAAAVLGNQLPFDVDVLKVDVPSDARLDTPWRLTRQSRQPYYITFKPGGEPPGDGGLVELDYKVSVDWETLDPSSDIYAFAHDRVIAVTPLSQDLTSRAEFAVLEHVLRAGDAGQ